MTQMAIQPPDEAADNQLDLQAAAEMRKRLYRKWLYREIERANALTDAETAATEDRRGAAPDRRFSGYGVGIR